MAKYMYRGKYVGDGIKGLLKEGGSSRREVVEKLISSVGGKLEGMYFSLGENDIYIIVDMPDNMSSAAVALTVRSTGTFEGGGILLLTPEEMDEAVKKTPNYRAAGQ